MDSHHIVRASIKASEPMYTRSTDFRGLRGAVLELLSCSGHSMGAYQKLPFTPHDLAAGDTPTPVGDSSR